MKGPFSHAITTSFDGRWEGCGDQIHCLAPSCPQPQWIKRPREWGGSASAEQPPALEMNDQLLKQTPPPTPTPESHIPHGW